jgi:hypothetical protein
MASHVDSTKHLFLWGRMMISEMDGILFSEKINTKERIIYYLFNFGTGV